MPAFPLSIKMNIILCRKVRFNEFVSGRNVSNNRGTSHQEGRIIISIYSGKTQYSGALVGLKATLAVTFHEFPEAPAQNAA